jgi:hypothetical protein
MKRVRQKAIGPNRPKPDAPNPNRPVPRLARLDGKRLVSVIGALIVFSVFVLKEGIRENAKDVRDAVSNAETVFGIRQDIRSTTRQILTEMRDQQYASELHANAKNGARTLALTDAEIMVEIEIQERQILQQLDRINALLERLPKDETLAAQVESIGRGARAVFEATKRLDSQTNWTSSLPASAIYTTAHARSDQSQSSVDDFAARVLTYAKDMGHSKDTTYRRVTWASYVLYTLGWALGLAGTLSGDKDANLLPQA